MAQPQRESDGVENLDSLAEFAGAVDEAKPGTALTTDVEILGVRHLLVGEYLGSQTLLVSVTQGDGTPRVTKEFEQPPTRTREALAETLAEATERVVKHDMELAGFTAAATERRREATQE